MKNKKDPMPSLNKRKKRIRKISIFTLAFISLFSFYSYKANKIKKAYDNLDISFTTIKQIEYGTANYNPLNLVENVKDGTIKNYTKTIDTKKVGVQEIEFEITNGDIVKKVNVSVEVKDTKAPNINLNSKEVNVYLGDNFDIKSNISSVNDVIDGEIPYKEEKTDKLNYTVTTDFDNTKVGNYNVEINAVDSNGNKNTDSYKINVINKPTLPTTKIEKNEVYSNNPSSVDTSSVIAAANSLIGSKYTSGGTSPTNGFDCSGFVQYIYNAIGKSISRSSSTQANDGFAVSRENLQPGDIIIWSTLSNNRPTHSSVYAGDNTIIHAINSSRGVQKSDLNYWENHGGGHIVTIRRV